MKDNPYFIVFLIFLIVLVLWYGYSIFFGRPPVVEPGTDGLIEDPGDYQGFNVDIKKNTGFFGGPKRIPYKQRRQLRENAFRNYMSVREDAMKAAETITREKRLLREALRGVAGRHYRKALESLAQKKYEKAISQFIDAIKAEPNNIIIRLLTYKRMSMIYKMLKYEKRYCVAMVKYLNLLEKFEPNNNVKEQIRNYKREIEMKLSTL